MSIKSELAKTTSYLRSARKAILGRGGEISLTAGLKDLPDAIFNIPADASLSYLTDDSVAYEKIVPTGASRFAQVNKIGGKSYPHFEGLRDTKVTALESEGASGELIDTIAIPEAVRSIYGYGWGVNEKFNSYITPSSGKFTRHTERQLVKDSTIVSNSIGDKPYLCIVLQNAVYGDPFGYGICDKFEIVRNYGSDIYLGQAMISRSENRLYLRTDMSVKDFKVQYADTVIEYALAEPVETDISEYLTDEFIKVEGGGTVTAVNEHENAVPSTITYIVKAGS
jgi:hypothetical protein